MNLEMITEFVRIFEKLDVETVLNESEEIKKIGIAQEWNRKGNDLR
jgi:hypothetical protein